VPVEQKRPDELQPFRNEIHALHWFEFGGEELSEGGDAFSVAAEGFGGGDGSVRLAVLGDGDVVGHFDGEVYHGEGGGGGEVGFGEGYFDSVVGCAVVKEVESGCGGCGGGIVWDGGGGCEDVCEGGEGWGGEEEEDGGKDGSFEDQPHYEHFEGSFW